jgi:hypothetical protein
MAITLSHAARFERRRARNSQDQELMHIRNLVRLRDILARHGATAAELRSYDAEINRQQRGLDGPHLAAA